MPVQQDGEVDTEGKPSCNGVVLVVEDDPRVTELMQLILESFGHQSVTAANGRVALDLLRTITKPCVILLDLMMPVMNGWQFFQAIKADAQLNTIPIIVVSAYAKGEIEVPPVETVPKPVDFAQLRQLVAKYCGAQ